MKTRIITVLGALLVALSATAQEWIGNLFSLDTLVEFKGAHTPKNLNLIKCRMEDNTFYFVEQQGFQYKDNLYQAVIHTLSTDDYGQTEIALPLPENGNNRERYARSLWINDFCFHGEYLLLTTQEELILYKRNHNQNYLVESTFKHPNLFMGYLHQNKLNFFEEDHDRGVKWFQQDLSSDSATLVRELPYEAPHLVQIQPNRYIFHDQQSVFSLSTRYPRMEVYDLDGSPLDTIRFNLPQWKAFEDDYIQKTLSVPYGIERIYAVKDDINAYSYPKIAIPLHGGVLLLYMQYDSLIGKSELQYALRKDNGTTSRHLWNNHEDSVYTAARFPFTLFHGGLDKGNAADKDLIVQLSYKTDVHWTGLTSNGYLNAVNRYFSEKEPTLAFKIMRFKPSAETVPPQLFTPYGETTRPDELPSSKKILILHNELECSGCMKALYSLFNQIGDQNIHIGHVYPHPINGLQAFEIKNRLQQHLQLPFVLYYDTTESYSDLVPSPLLENADFPCLILYQNGQDPRIVRSNDIFTAINSLTEFSPSFLHLWQSFVDDK